MRRASAKLLRSKFLPRSWFGLSLLCQGDFGGSEVVEVHLQKAAKVVS